MDLVNISSSASRATVRIPQAKDFYDEITRLIGGSEEEKCDSTDFFPEALEEKSSAANDQNDSSSLDLLEPLELLERVESVHARFLKEAKGACQVLDQVKPSKKVVLEGVEETERIVAVNSLLVQIIKFQKLTDRYEGPLVRLQKRVRLLKRELLANDPVLSLGPSESLRNWGTVAVSTLKKSAFPPFVIPLDPKEAFTELEKHPLSDRCKVQILVKIFQENDRLLYVLNRFEENVKSAEKGSKAPPIGEIVGHFLNFPHLFSIEDQEVIRAQVGSDSCDLKVILDVIHQRQKCLLANLDELQLGVEKRFSFRQRKVVYSFLHQILKQEDEREQKALNALSVLLDPMGAVRAVIVLERSQSAIRTGLSLGRLLTRLAESQPPATIIQRWHRVLMEERMQMNLNLDLRSLVRVHARFQGQIKYEGASLCVEWLMHCIDPTGIRVAAAFLDRKPSLQNYCGAYAAAEMVLFKMCCVFKLSEVEFSPYQKSLHSAFEMQTKGLRSKSSTSPRKGERVDFSETVLPLLKSGKLSKSQRLDLVQTLFYRSAMLFASMPVNIFYADTWKKTPEYLNFVREADRLMQFVFVNITKGSSAKERAHIMGQFHLISLEALEMGELFFSLYMAETQAKLWTKKFENAFEIFHINSQYRKAEETVKTVFDRSRNYSATKEQEAKLLRSGRTIVPHLPMHTQELRFLFDSESNTFDILTMGNRFIHMIFTMRYWLGLQEGQFTPGTTFLEEWSRYAMQDDDMLYNLI